MAPPNAPETNDSPKPTSGIISENDVPETRWSPESVLSELPQRPVPDTDSPLPFFHLLERLKTTKREGWRRFGIVHGESISDHMYRMSILTMLAPPSLSSRVNIPHCTKMALIHDMAESLVGDITPVDPISKEEKSRRESETMDYLCKRLLGNVGGGLSGAEIRKVWQEYEDNETLEAKYVHDIDKMELLLQMMEYERGQEGRLDVGEFTWVATKIVLPEIKDWAEQVFEERRQFWKKVGKEPSWGGDRKSVS
ncbi:putative hd family protein [Neofusicoccum parvum UCRNP2]|uniref:5'-deoxynucleotidase n=1 Tax=Botryosphaeria parva (strain UCR-NP2) TaxID=1287680 RepID=R1E7X4_BOTPV|nr:putative hd family protein [Neofusicoccum parvum UCRNP2]